MSAFVAAPVPAVPGDVLTLRAPQWARTQLQPRASGGSRDGPAGGFAGALLCAGAALIARGLCRRGIARGSRLPAVARSAKRKGSGSQKSQKSQKSQPAASASKQKGSLAPDPEALPEAKERLLQACEQANYKSGVFTPPDECKEIEEAARAVELLNSAKTIAKTESNMLTGGWTMLYSTAESLTAGLWGPLIGDVTQTMEASQKQYLCCSEFFGGVLKMQWYTTWTVVDNQTITLPGEDWYPFLFNIRLSFWSLTNDDGVTLKMTYTDDKLRIFRQERFDKRMNRMDSDLFVFQRKSTLKFKD